MTDLIITGVGGQGIVLTSKLIAAAAMEKGYDVMSAETIGMAQKGGSVVSCLRIGHDIKAPMFPKGSADILIGFEPAEAVRMLPYLKKGGTVILNIHPIMPVTAALTGGSYSGSDMVQYLESLDIRLVSLDADKLCREIGSPKVLNMIMLGAAVNSGVLPFTLDDAEAVMRKTVKPQFAEMNAKALRCAVTA